MPEAPEPAADSSAEPVPAKPPEAGEAQESDIGEFISRNVLDKDSVFFEG
jgi:hypothetical protein